MHITQMQLIFCLFKLVSEHFFTQNSISATLFCLQFFFFLLSPPALSLVERGKKEASGEIALPCKLREAFLKKRLPFHSSLYYGARKCVCELRLARGFFLDWKTALLTSNFTHGIDNFTRKWVSGGGKFSRLTVEHDFPGALLPDVHVGGAVGHGPFLGGVALVQSGRVDLEHVGGAEDEVEALEAGEAARVVHQYHVVTNAAVADAPHGNRVEKDGQGRVGDGGYPRHDGLRHELPLISGRKVATAVNIS